ncbi:Ig-like domain-containing protein [uncultured Roseibium sp.]|uniref:Ig-like domain-containing protein n=1 Tax=uncultured Roseibium sp. TaxID=1936171 RepID=UPI003217FEE8
MSLVLNITNSSGETERLSPKLNGTYPIPQGSVIEIESISGLTDVQWQDGRLTLTFTDGVVILEGLTVDQLEALAPTLGDIQTSALGNDGETDGGGLDLARLFSNNTNGNSGQSSVNSFETGIETGLGGTDDGQGQPNITPSSQQRNDAQTTPNSVPSAEAISGLVNENGSAISLSASFTDLDAADTHSFSIDVTGTAGQVTNNGDGTFSYETNGAFESLGVGETATDSFTYTVTDSTGASSTAIATVTIEGENDAPVGTNGSASGNEDTAITGTVTANDVDGDSLTYALATGGAPAHGTVTFNGSQYTYTPDADFNGVDSFDIEISDGNGGTDTVTIAITVDPVNDAPVGANGSASGDEDTAITGTVAASDVDGDSLSFALAAGRAPAHGSVSFTGSQYTYTPDADFNGSDSFDVEISDGNGGTDTVTIAITVDPVNDAPVGANGSASGDEDTAITGTVAASDVDGDSLTYALATGGAPTHGTVSFNGSQYTYTPDTDFNGSDSFDVEISDGNGGTDIVTIALTVDAVNDAPVLSATGSPAAVNEAGDASAQDIGALTGNLTVSDADGGDTLTASADGAPSLVWSGGTLSAAQEASLLAALGTGKLSFDGSVAADGSAQSLGWSWDPAAADLDFLASGDTLTVTYDVAVSDGTLTTATQPLTFTIAGTNDAPVAYMDTGTMTEDDGPKTFDVLSNDMLDPDAGALNTVTVGNITLGANSYGLTASDVQVTVTADNQLTVELLGSKWDAMWNGQTLPLTIQYRLNGDNGEFAGNQLSLTIQGRNDAPVLDASADLAISITEDAGLPGAGEGTLVSDLVDRVGGGGLDNVTDDSFITGIAITGTNTAHGTWYYSTNDGASWSAIASVSDAHALTLRPDARVAFVPDAGYNGTIADGLTVRAWDGTGGANGSYWNTTNNGGTTGYSTQTDTVAITVDAVNDAPVLSATGSPAAVNEAGDASAQDIGALTGNLTVSDADAGDTVTASVDGAPSLVWSGGTLSAAQEASLLAALGTGKLSFDGSVAADGSAQSLGWSWDPAAADLDFLASGDTLTVTYDVAVSDGTLTTATQPLTFTIAGTNDAPVAYMDTGTMTEDDGPKTFDVLSNDMLDPDAGALNTVTVGNITLGANSYGLTASDVQVTVTADNQLTVELLGSKWDAMWNGQTLPLTIQYRLNGDNGEFAGNQLSLTIQGRNDAPVLDASADLAISITEDAGLPGAGEGTLVSDLVDRVGGGGLDNVTDDSFITGIAITGTNTAHGTWYYSTNDGASWSAIASVSDAHALTLRPDARVAFVPDAGYNGTIADGLTVRAWDGTGGANGSYWNTTNNGGTTGYSTQTDTVAITVDAVNDAPVLSATGSPAAVNEAGDASAQDIGALTGNLTVSDADAGDTVTASVDGAPSLVWSGGTLSAAQEASLLAALGTGKLSFDGSVAADGSAQSLGWSWDPAAADLDFLASGDTLTVTYDVAVSDGTLTTATQPLTFTIAGTNDAPVAYMDTGTMTEDDGPKTFDVLSNDTLDPDAGALNTVTVGNITLGANSYGLTASDVQVTVTADNQLTVELLGSKWDAMWNGETLPLTIQYRLNGDNGEFAGNQLSLTIQGRNDAPVLDASADLAISITEDAGLPGAGEGTLVSDLVDRVGGGGLDNVTDDSFITGIAITGTNTAHGTWYYSTSDGASWSAIASVSDAHALTLRPDARVAFVPDAGYNGTIADGLTVRAWDGTGGANGSYWNTTNNGGTTGYSTQTDTVAITVDAVNDAPVITFGGGGASASITVDDSLTGVATVTATDANSDPLTYSISGGADQALFTIDASTGALSFLSTPDYANPGDAGADNVYDVQVQVADGQGGIDIQDIAVKVSDRPEVSTSGSFTFFTAGDEPVTVPSGLTVSALTQIASATVMIGTHAAGDVLAIDAAVLSGTGITANYNAGSGILTLTGAADAATYQAVLRQVTYSSSSADPTQNDTNNSRPIYFQVENVDGLQSNDANTFVGVNVPPELAGLDNAEFSVADATSAAQIIDPNVSFTDSGQRGMASGRLAVSGFIDGEDVIGIHHEGTGSGQIGVSGDQISYGGTVVGSFTGGSGSADLVVSLNGNATAAAVDALIQNLTYFNTSGSPSGSRTLTVTLADNQGASVSETVDVTLTGQNTAPIITSNASVRLDENTKSVVTVVASDAENDELTFSISGGDDAALFTIDADNGALSFITTPDFENPQDVGENNIYQVAVTVSDGKGGSDVQTISVSVDNLGEAPTDITWNALPIVTGRDLPIAGDVLANLSSDDETATYALGSGSDAGFSISESGVVTLQSTLQANTTYTLNLEATNSNGSYTETFKVVVGGADYNESLGSTSSPASQIIYGNGNRDSTYGGGGDDTVLSSGDYHHTGHLGSGDDTVFLRSNEQSIFGGWGIDTLVLAKTDMNLDFNFPGAGFNSFERVEMAGFGSNTLTLDAQDLLDLSDDVSGDTTTLTVVGDSGDKVVLTGSGWTQQADTDIDGTDYHVYTNDTGTEVAKLVVQDQVAVNAAA